MSSEASGDVSALNDDNDAVTTAGLVSEPDEHQTATDDIRFRNINSFTIERRVLPPTTLGKGWWGWDGARKPSMTMMTG